MLFSSAGASDFFLPFLLVLPSPLSIIQVLFPSSLFFGWNLFRGSRNRGSRSREGEREEDWTARRVKGKCWMSDQSSKVCASVRKKSEKRQKRERERERDDWNSGAKHLFFPFSCLAVIIIIITHISLSLSLSLSLF